MADGTTRFITLHGEGGIGKTRLARAVGVAAGELFADGVAFVPLVEASQAADIPEMLLKALQVRSLGKRDPLVQLNDYLAERQLLLIIDNLEHLLGEEETAVLLLNLLQAAPHLKLLVTSRQQVWVQAETVVRLDGLPIPDPSVNGTWLASAAVQLFVARMRQLDAHFDPADKREAIVDICRAVQGLPLGIELAVAESHIRSCEAVAQSLRHDLALQTRMRDVPRRQASLQAVFDHSWRLLELELQRLLAQCAMMRGDFSAAAFVAVTAGRHDQLQLLVDHALVRQVGDDRYDMHEVVRHFALEQLGTADRATARERYAAYFLHLVAEQEEAFITNMEPALAIIRREWHHIETAWDEAVAKTAVDLFDAAVPALCTYWIITGHASSTLARLEAAHACLAVAAPQPRLAAACAKIEGALIWISYTTGEVAQSIALAQRILREAEMGTSEPFAIVAASCTLGSLQMLRGQLTQTEQLLTQGYTLAIQHSLPIWQSVATFLMMMLFGNQGQIAECAIWTHRSVDCVAPNRYLQLGNEASWHFRTWELSTCLAQIEEKNRVLQRLGQETCIDATFTLRASAYHRCGAFEQVIAMYEAARRDVSLDNQQFIRYAGYYVLAHVERQRGNLEAALRYGQLAVKYTTDMAPGFHYFFACDALALVLCALGRPAEAQTLLHTALDHLRGSELADHWYILIEGSLAHSYALAGEWQRATEMAGELVDRLLATDVATTQMEQTWFCYQILARYGDGRAADLLAHMQAVIQQRADRLAPEHRYDFINNFPEHRAVMAQAGVSVVFA
ncbi:MAG: AAA family ATPase [Anaerolineales bacterium]|nr:AAA family ATPase [Anaerolineales bacterium]